MISRRDKIKSINIKKFRKLKDIEFEFGERITIISGHNSIGKSTILGLIANGSESREKHLLNKQFRSRFNELFDLDHYFDYEKPKEINEEYSVLLEYKYDSNKEIKECKISNHEGRLKIVPRSVDEDGKKLQSTAKINIPTLYLGLSRLIPMGETAKEHLQFTKKQSIEQEDIDYYHECYKAVLGDHNNDKGIFEHRITSSSKHSLIQDFKEYGIQTISSGQDSLSSILTALTSFNNLKKNSEDYHGGILLIDEIDCTLHLSAQKKLFNLLKKECKRLSLQVIATTHSLTFLQEILLAKEDSEKGDIESPLYEICYISGYKVPVKRNDISYRNLKNDLLSASQDIKVSDSYPIVKFYFEDEEAKFLFESIFEEYRNYFSEKIQTVFISLMTSCENLVKLPSRDDYFQTTVIVPDGDVGMDSNTSGLIDYIEEQQNIVKLFGNKSPEEETYNLLKNIYEDDEHRTFFEVYGEKLADTRVEVILKEIDDALNNGNNQKKRRDHFKKWFNQYKSELKAAGFFKYYVEKNFEHFEQFSNDINRAIDYTIRLTTLTKLQ